MKFRHYEHIDPAAIISTGDQIGCFRPTPDGYAWYPGELDGSDVYKRVLTHRNMYFGAMYYLLFQNSHTPQARIRWRSVSAPTFHPLECVTCRDYSTPMSVTIPSLVEGGTVNLMYTNITFPIVNVKLADLIKNYPVMLDIENSLPVLKVFDHLATRVKTKIPLKWTKTNE